MFDMIYSGRKIAEARKEMNITQMELADRLNISCFKLGTRNLHAGYLKTS